MKKIIVLFTTILIICMVSVSGISANAAEVKKYDTAVNEIAPDTQNDASSESSQVEPEDDELPSSYSSADLGYTTSVKNQTGGNLCWAYSSVSTFETLMLKNGSFFGDLSPNAIDLWGCRTDDGEGWQRSAGDSGYTSISVGYFTSWSGPVAKNAETDVQYGATGIRFLNKSDRTDIKKSIMKSGAVTANYNNNSLGRSVDRNAFFITDSIGVISGHSISIVGWDDNYSKDNFTGNYQPENDGAWLCKNSWGEGYNTIDGYLWISYEDHFLLNSEIFDEGFSVESFQKITEDDHLYQNEIYGATYEFEYVNKIKQTYFNVFDFSQNGNKLDKVIFETNSQGASYKTYYVPLNPSGAPVKDRSQWTELSEGVVDYRGYICSDFEDYIVPKAKAAIAVELDNSANDRRCGIGVSEWLRDPDTQIIFFRDQCKEGNSFIEYNNEMLDLRDYFLTYNHDDIGGTFVIKAITNFTTDTTHKGDVNLDETVDINDVTLIQLHLVGLREDLYADQLTNADYNNDGKININDATQIQLNIAKN